MMFPLIILLFLDFSLAACPPGMTEVPSVFEKHDYCLSYSSHGSQFLMAENDCINKGGHLVSVENPFFNMFIARE